MFFQFVDVDHAGGLVGVAIQRGLPGYIEGRLKCTTRPTAHFFADVDHAGGFMSGAFQCSLPGYIEGRLYWTTRLAAHLAADVYHATLAAHPS